LDDTQTAQTPVTAGTSTTPPRTGGSHSPKVAGSNPAPLSRPTNEKGSRKPRKGRPRPEGRSDRAAFVVPDPSCATTTPDGRSMRAKYRRLLLWSPPSRRAWRNSGSRRTDSTLAGAEPIGGRPPRRLSISWTSTPAPALSQSSTTSSSVIGLPLCDLPCVFFVAIVSCVSGRPRGLRPPDGRVDPCRAASGSPPSPACGSARAALRRVRRRR
jgi:hypothetical protein